MKLNIEDLIFIDDTYFVYTEGVDEYWNKYQNNIPFDNVRIIFQENGKYYAGEGRHRTFMLYHRARQTTIDVDIIKDFKLNKTHLADLESGNCVTIKDLKEISMYE